MTLFFLRGCRRRHEIPALFDFRSSSPFFFFSRPSSSFVDRRSAPAEAHNSVSLFLFFSLIAEAPSNNGRRRQLAALRAPRGGAAPLAVVVGSSITFVDHHPERHRLRRVLVLFLRCCCLRRARWQRHGDGLGCSGSAGDAPDRPGPSGARRRCLLDGDDAETCARRESEEEAGFRVKTLVKTFDADMSPGSVIETISCFVGTFDPASRVSAGGGLEHEGEDIEVVELPLTKALKMIDDGRITDGKSILLLQWLALHPLAG